MNLPVKIRVVTFLFAVLLPLYSFRSPVSSHPEAVAGQGGESPADKLRQIREQIAETEKLLGETRSKKATLQNEISYQENQIRLTTLKIDETEAEIGALSGQIDRLEGVLTGLSGVFAERAVETYKVKRLGSPLTLLLTADSVNEFISRFHYLRRIQENDRELLVQMQSTQTSYEGQREKVQELHDRLETQKTQLARQKAQKQQLLDVTKNDEKRYQGLLAELRADAESIRRALGGVGVQIGPKKKGDVIASVGNSGCSTGPHLHFEVMVPASVQKEGDKFIVVDKENKVDPKPYLDSGQFGSPLASYPRGDCSQGGTCYYGDITTRFNQWYNILGGSYHTGLDIADYYGEPIFAVADGVAYEFQDTQACSLTGTVGRGVVLDHDNSDVVTLYWHIP